MEVLPYEAIKGKKSNEISDIVRQKMLAHLDADDWTYDLKLKNIPQQEDAREQPKVESEHTDSVNDTDTSTGEN